MDKKTAGLTIENAFSGLSNKDMVEAEQTLLNECPTQHDIVKKLVKLATQNFERRSKGHGNMSKADNVNEECYDLLYDLGIEI